MLFGAYVPFDELTFPLTVFEIKDVCSFLVGSYEYESKKPELLLVFEAEEATALPGFTMENRFEVNSIPEDAFYLQIGEVADAGAFICNPDQTEALPEEQADKRRKLKQYIKSHIDDNPDYKNFLQVQKTGFVMYLLPLWAPFIISRFTGIPGEISLDSELTETDKIKADGLICNGYVSRAKNTILNGYFGKYLGANDLCWCGSNLKYKKCHLSNV